MATVRQIFLITMSLFFSMPHPVLVADESKDTVEIWEYVERTLAAPGPTLEACTPPGPEVSWKERYQDEAFKKDCEALKPQRDKLFQDPNAFCNEMPAIPYVFNVTQRNLRITNKEWRRKVFIYARDSFWQLTHDREIQRRCCGNGNSACAKSFSKTKLNILFGLGPSDNTAHYKPMRRAVEISESVVLSCQTHVCLDALFFHELGHACQNAYARSQSLYADLRVAAAGDVNCKNDEYSRFGFRERLGEKQRTCLITSNPTNEECPAKRDQEMFANAIFAPLWTHPSHFSWSCSTDGDEIHLKFKRYLGCILQNPEVQKNFCKEVWFPE
ncbi:hypothetical protein WDW86_07875 [Bdellovibrionota bacterium FG-2]